MKSFYAILAFFAVMLGFTETALAASQIPETLAATLTTDVQDTFGDVMAWVWALFPIVALGWFGFNQMRKGAGKFGAK